MSKFFYKTIRAGKEDYWEQFELEILGIERKPLRIYSDDRSRQWVVRPTCESAKNFRSTGELEYETVQVSAKTPLPKTVKAFATKHQSLSYCDTNWPTLPPVFGHDKRENLVGVAIAPENVFVHRIFQYDGGTYGRSYACPTQQAAQNYLDNKIADGKLLRRLDDIQKNLGSYNEVQGRVRYHHLAPLKIMIFTDNPESRLLAICRKRSLELTSSRTLNFHADIEIFFYPTKDQTEPHEYTLNAQKHDIASHSKTHEYQPYIDVLTHLLREQHSQQGGGAAVATYSSIAGVANYGGAAAPAAPAVTGSLKPSKLLPEELVAMAPIALKLGTLTQQQFMYMRPQVAKTVVPELQIHYTPNMWQSIQGVYFQPSKDNIKTQVEYLCSKGMSEKLEEWLSSPNVNSAQRLSPVILCEAVSTCVRYNNSSCLNILIKYGTNVNQRDANGKTPLHLACEYDHLDVVRLVLKHAANVDQPDKFGRTPLHIACQQGHLEVVRLVLEHVANVHQPYKYDNTLLHIACEYGRIDVVRFLLKYGADINQLDKCAKRPLHIACKQGHLDVVRLLLGHAANVQQPDKFGETPLRLACEYGRLDVVRFLLEHGANVNQRDQYGQTPLTVACQYGHLEVVRLLLAAPGIYVNQPDKYCGTPLHIACRHGLLEAVRLLLVAPGIDVNQAKTDGTTPLIFACEYGHLEVVRLLLAASGIDVNQAKTDGTTPLHTTCARGYFDVVQLLLRYRACINQTTTQGKTPLYFAREYCHPEVVRLLQAAARKDSHAQLQALSSHFGRKAAATAS